MNNKLNLFDLANNNVSNILSRFDQIKSEFSAQNISEKVGWLESKLKKEVSLNINGDDRISMETEKYNKIKGLAMQLGINIVEEDA